MLDVLSKATDDLNASNLAENGRINFNVHAYGENEWIDYNAVRQMVVDGELAAIEVGREKDIPFRTQGIDFLDFGYFFETKDWEKDILTGDEEDMLGMAVADFLEEYGLIIHHNDGYQGFGHYRPWYVDGKTPTRLEYGLDEITDLHPYSALKADSRHDCDAHASLEIYEDDFIVMECNVCGKTATFKQEGPYKGPRRNPVSKKTGKTIGLIGGAIVAAFVAKKVLD